MTKKQFTEFTCDTCGKKEASFCGFPYEKEWCYIYNIDGKALEEHFEGLETNVKTLCAKDLHFCSLKCLLVYVRKKFKSGAEKGAGLKAE